MWSLPGSSASARAAAGGSEWRAVSLPSQAPGAWRASTMGKAPIASTFVSAPRRRAPYRSGRSPTEARASSRIVITTNQLVASTANVPRSNGRRCVVGDHAERLPSHASAEKPSEASIAIVPAIATRASVEACARLRANAPAATPMAHVKRRVQRVAEQRDRGLYRIEVAAERRPQQEQRDRREPRQERADACGAPLLHDHPHGRAALQEQRLHGSPLRLEGERARSRERSEDAEAEEQPAEGGPNDAEERIELARHQRAGLHRARPGGVQVDGEDEAVAREQRGDGRLDPGHACAEHKRELATDHRARLPLRSAAQEREEDRLQWRVRTDSSLVTQPVERVTGEDPSRVEQRDARRQRLRVRHLMDAQQEAVAARRMLSEQRHDLEQLNWIEHAGRLVEEQKPAS